MTSADLKTVMLEIPFSSDNTALAVQEVLNVDRELKKSEISREITTVGDILLIKLSGLDLKKIRVSVNALIKNILLIIKTIEQFSN